jgi:Tfp pilus assembly PilM family ATPase
MISLLKRRKIAQFRGHRGWAAIFFGESSLDLTTARGSGGDVSVENQTSAPLPPAEEAADAKSRWQTAVQDLRQKLNPHEHRIVTAIRGEDVLCQTLRLPSTQVEELRQMLDLQIDNLTPLPVEEVVYSFEPLETTNSETSVLVAVAPKTAVNERVEVLEAAGFQPEVVGVDILAVFRNFLRSQLLPTDEKLNAFVQISPTAANIVVHTHGVPVAIRSVVLGEASLGSVESRTALREELQWTLVAAEADQPDREIGRVTLATWSENLRAEVEELARGWNGEAQCYTNGSAPSPATSLCIETAASDATRLNLLPDEWRQRRRAAQRRRRLILSGIVLGTIYLLGLAVFLSLMRLQQSRLNDVKAKIAQRQTALNDARELQRLLVTTQKQLDTKYSALEILRQVSDVMPENVKLNGFTFKKDLTVALKAQAQSVPIANDFISRLEQCTLFSKVTPGQMRTELPAAGGLTKFEVTCTLKSASPVPVGSTIWH